MVDHRCRLRLLFWRPVSSPGFSTFGPVDSAVVQHLRSKVAHLERRERMSGSRNIIEQKFVCCHFPEKKKGIRPLFEKGSSWTNLLESVK